MMPHHRLSDLCGAWIKKDTSVIILVCGAETSLNKSLKLAPQSDISQHKLYFYAIIYIYFSLFY